MVERRSTDRVPGRQLTSLRGGGFRSNRVLGVLRRRPGDLAFDSSPASVHRSLGWPISRTVVRPRGTAVRLGTCRCPWTAAGCDRHGGVVAATVVAPVRWDAAYRALRVPFRVRLQMRWYARG